MTRADELTTRLIDGPLADPEAAELDALLADPAARAHHLGLLEVEAALRGLRTDLDLSGPVLARITAARADRTTRAVMATIADRPSPAWGRRRRTWPAVVAVAAALLVGVWLALPPDRPAVDTPAPAVARVTALTGSVEVLDPDGRVAPADPDRPLAPGQTVRTVGEESTAVVEFPDHGRFELHPDTAVRFRGDGAGPRELFLAHGQLTAAVGDAPTVVATGAADVVARGGRFAVWSAGPGSVRVEATEGDVRVVRAASPVPVPVEPGRAAFVGDETARVHVESRSGVVTEPRAAVDFRGAQDVAFAPGGGEVWAASAKQLWRWPVGAAVEKVLYAPPPSNDGVAALFTPDRRFLITCRGDDRDDQLTVRDLPSGAGRATIPVRVSEQRFLAVAPDASWAATAGGRGPSNRRVRVWDAATGRERWAADVDDVVSTLAAAPDGRRLAVGVSDLGRGMHNEVVFLDAAAGTRVFALSTRRKGLTALAFSPDGRFLAAGFNGRVQVWDVPGRRLVRTIEGFERVVTRLAWSPDGGRLAAGTLDGQVWVWATATGRRVRVIGTGTHGVRAVAFGPDGTAVVSATNKGPVAVWDVGPGPADDGDPDA